MIDGLSLRRLLRVLALALAVPLGLLMLLEIVTLLLARTGADVWPIVVVVDVLTYVVMGLAFVLIPGIVVVMLLLTLGKLRRPGSPAPPHAG